MTQLITELCYGATVISGRALGGTIIYSDAFVSGQAQSNHGFSMQVDCLDCGDTGTPFQGITDWNFLPTYRRVDSEASPWCRVGQLINSFVIPPT